MALGLAATTTTFARAEDIVLKVAYASDFEPATPELGKAWWDDVIKQFQAKHPNVKVELNQDSRQFQRFGKQDRPAFSQQEQRSRPGGPGRSQSEPVGLDRLFAAARQICVLRELVGQLRSAAQSQRDHQRACLCREPGDQRLWPALRQSIVRQGWHPDAPWTPKTWADILEAGRKLKAASPDTYPLWIQTGTSQGTFGVFAGPGDFLVGSSDPTILDKDGKWVVVSKGLRETIQFYKDAAAEGLLAPASQIMDAMAESTPPTAMPQHKIGICLAGNWYPDLWTKAVNQPYYPDDAKDIGVAPLPTINGAAPQVATMIGGWTLAIGSGTKHPELAWDLIDIAQSQKNMLYMDLVTAIIPPIPSLAQSSDYSDVAPPFRAEFAKMSLHGVLAPQDPNYSVWGQGLLTATQAVVLDPKLSVDDAIAKMKDLVSNQVGPDSVAVRN